MKNILKISALALTMSLILFGCANPSNGDFDNNFDSDSTNQTVPEVPSVPSVKPNDVVPTDKPEQTNDTKVRSIEELKSILYDLEMEPHFIALINGIESDLVELSNETSQFYTDFIKKAQENLADCEFNEQNKTYTANNTTVKIDNVNAKLSITSESQDGINEENVTINGTLNGSIVIDSSKYVPESSTTTDGTSSAATTSQEENKIKKIAINLSTNIDNFNWNDKYPSSNSNPSVSQVITLSGKGRVKGNIAIYFDTGAKSGIFNIEFDVGITDFGKLKKEIDDLLPNFETVNNSAKEVKDYITGYTKELNKLTSVKFSVKANITDTKGNETLNIVNAKDFDTLKDAVLKFIDADTSYDVTVEEPTIKAIDIKTIVPETSTTQKDETKIKDAKTLETILGNKELENHAYGMFINSISDLQNICTSEAFTTKYNFQFNEPNKFSYTEPAVYTSASNNAKLTVNKIDGSLTLTQKNVLDKELISYKADGTLDFSLELNTENYAPQVPDSSEPSNPQNGTSATTKPNFIKKVVINFVGNFNNLEIDSYNPISSNGPNGSNNTNEPPKMLMKGGAYIKSNAAIYYNDGKYEGVLNVDLGAKATNATKLFEKIINIIPSIEELQSPNTTIADYENVAALLDKLPATIYIKENITDIQGNETLHIVNANTFTEILTQAKNYMPGNNNQTI